MTSNRFDPQTLAQAQENYWQFITLPDNTRSAIMSELRQNDNSIKAVPKKRLEKRTLKENGQRKRNYRGR